MLVGAVVFFGLRANGSVASELTTVDRSVWLVDPPMGTLVRVNALAQDVTTTVDVAGQQDVLSAAQSGASAVVLNRSTGDVGRVDGATLEYEAGRSLGSAGADLALVGNDAAAFAVDTSAGRLVALNPSNLSTRYESTVNGQQALPSVVDAQGRLWVYDAKVGEIVRFDGADGDVRRSAVAEPGTAAQLTLVNDRPMLVIPSESTAIRLHGDGSAGERLCIGGTEQGGVLVAGSPVGESPQLFTLSLATGDVSVTDVDAGTCNTSVQLSDENDRDGDGFGQPVALEGRLYVPVLTGVGGSDRGGEATGNRGVRAQRRVAHQVLVLAGGAIERTIDLDFVVPADHRFELFADDGLLWFNDLEGSKAGVLSAGGTTLIVDKKDQSSISGRDIGENGLLSEDLPTVTVDAPGEEGGAGGEGPGSNAATGDGTGDPNDGTGEGGGGDGRSGRGEQRPGAENANSSNPTGTTIDANAIPPVTSPSAALPPASTIPAPAGPSPVGAGPDRKPTTTPTTAPNPGDALTANFTYSPAGDPTTETSLTFVDASSGMIDRYLWIFTAPDGTTSSVEGQTVTRTLNAVGQWTVTLTVSNRAGRMDSTRPIALQVRDASDLLPPHADFTWDPSTPVVGNAVAFQDRSTAGRNAPLTAWFWEFGDGTTSTQQKPAPKTYAAAGTYTVKLTVRNSVGAHSISAPLRVATPPAPLEPEFSYAASGGDPTRIVAGQAALFTDHSGGGPTSWLWNFGDGSSAAGEAVAHRFAAAGAYNVKLTVSNADGTESTTKTITVHEPQAAPKALISEPQNGVTVQVDALVRFTSGSTGNPTTLVWNWGDNTTSEGASATHTFKKAGEVLVTLTAANSAGSTSANVVVKVTNSSPPPAPPQPSFRTTTGTSPTDPARLDRPVQFVNTSQGTGTFAWSFGDGGTSTERDPKYTYKKAGTFHVTLTMTGPGGSRTAAGDVYVGPPPVKVEANFDYTPKNATVGQQITFTDTTTGTPTSWTWNFADGTPSVSGQKPPPKVYAAAGKYNVTLTVVDRDGAVTTKSQVVTVADAPRTPPVAAFTVTPPTGHVAGKAITFTDTTVALFPLTTPVFTFEGAPVSPPAGSRAVDHVFTRDGTFLVTMKVCWADDPTNCGTASQELVVKAQEAKPQPKFSVGGPGVLGDGVLQTNKSITFTDTSEGSGDSKREWIIGQRTETAPTVPDLVLASAGTLNVTLTLTNSAGSASATKTYVVVPDAPVARFEAPATVDVDQPATFRDLSVLVPLGALRTWHWDDGTDPTPGTANGATHTFTKPGAYTVTLRLSILDLPIAEATVVVTVQPGVPKPKIAASVNGAAAVTDLVVSVKVGDTVRFSDQSVAPVPDTRAWSIDDGPATTAATLDHKFDTIGAHTVRLVSSNSSGSTATTMTIIVTPASAPNAAPSIGAATS